MRKILNNPFLKFLFGFTKVIVWIFVILIVLVIGVQRLFNNQVSIGSYRMFTIVTGSMMPEYEVYDVIIVKEEDPKDIQVGDDLTYLGKIGDYKDKVITHRVKKNKAGKWCLLLYDTRNSKQYSRSRSSRRSILWYCCL